MENLQGLPIARRVIREQEVPPSSDVDGQGAAGIKPCRCRPILGQGRTKIFTVGIRHSLFTKNRRGARYGMPLIWGANMAMRLLALGRQVLWVTEYNTLLADGVKCRRPAERWLSKAGET
jgi:hypothetical protein